MSVKNPAQERQDRYPSEIIVRGFTTLQEAMTEEVGLTDLGQRKLGKATATLYELATLSAEVNGDSLERSIVNLLLTRGFKLDEFEVEIDQEKTKSWGRCIWYKEHPNYQKPIPEPFENVGFDARFYHATFKTENAGDQQFCIYSVQMGYGILLHKTLMYRRVVLVPPAQASTAAA